MNRFISFIIFLFFSCVIYAQTPIWTKHEIQLSSSKIYNNPVYDVKDFKITFTAPSGRKRIVRGFWNGGTNWKIRFLPDEIGTWKWETRCSDKKEPGIARKKRAIILNSLITLKMIC